MKHFFLALLLLGSSDVLYSQVSQAWVQRLSTAASDYPAQMVTDGSGNVYITGTAGSSSYYSDIITRKYNSAGTLQWSTTYNSPYNNSDVAGGITRDASGNIYITGTAFTGTNSYNAVTIKYNSAGVLQWSALFNPATGYLGSEGFAITTDASGNVYVAGHSDPLGGYKDNYLTLKYNSSGALQWSQQYAGTADGLDQAKFIKVDNSGNIYICGESMGATKRKVFNRDGTITIITVKTLLDIVTVKYNSSGVQQWAARYNGTGNDNDSPAAMLIDSIGNVFITGTASTTGGAIVMITMKYDYLGANVWTVLRSNSYAGAMARDASGNIIVTGGLTTGPLLSDLLLVKYNPSGTELWASTYNAGLNDNGSAIILDGSGNFYVAASSVRQSSPNAQTSDIVTCKFNTSGSLQWAISYNGPGNASDVPVSIGLYTNPIVFTPPSVYVAGYDNGGASGNDWVLVKYTQPSTVCCVVSKAASVAAPDESKSQFRIENFPNPFTNSTTIRYEIPRQGRVSITVFDAAGRRVASIEEGTRNPGVYTKTFDGSRLGTGIYQYKVILKSAGGDLIETKTMSIQ